MLLLLVHVGCGEHCSSPMQQGKDASSGAGDSTGHSVGTARGTAWGQAGPGAKPWAQPQPWLPAHGSAAMPGADGQPEPAPAACQVCWSQSWASTVATSPLSLCTPCPGCRARRSCLPLPRAGVLRAPPEQSRSGPAARPTTSSQPGVARSLPFGVVCSAPAPGAAAELHSGSCTPVLAEGRGSAQVQCDGRSLQCGRWRLRLRAWDTARPAVVPVTLPGLAVLPAQAGHQPQPMGFLGSAAADLHGVEDRPHPCAGLRCCAQAESAI